MCLKPFENGARVGGGNMDVLIGGFTLIGLKI